MKTSYRKGVLVWIDDNFLEHEFLKENDQIDKWQAIFGDFSKKIYRLLDLELKIITCKSDFEYYLELIANDLDTYHYFIVDLSLPDAPGSEPEVVNGLDIGVVLKDKNYDFCFLSSSSSAGSEMQEVGLGSADYYVKFEDSDLLPEALRHKILLSFRNNISWIELSIIKEFLNPNSNLLKPKESKKLSKDEVQFTISTFPYYDKFRDFLDRTEYSSNTFNKLFFIRSHRDNSLEFEHQCILIMLADRIFHNPNKVLVEYGLFTDDNFKMKAENSSENIFWIVKLDSKIKINEFVNFYKKVKRKQIAFIVDDNEAAEKFLERVSPDHANLKDLPYIQETDLDLRSLVIQKSIQLFLNHFSKLEKENKIAMQYLEHPELLIHPKNMMFLENSKLMTSSLSDIPEILQSLLSGFKSFFDSHINIYKKQAISEGKPIAPTCMLKIADDVLSKKIHIKINHRALIYGLDKWLRHAWEYPYGIDLVEKEWKKFSFEVLLMLIQEFDDVKKDLHDSELDHFYEPITMISNLLKSNTVKKLLEGKSETVTVSEWEDLAYLRWPHLQYPMPMHLNEILEQSGKHLWIQHKNFNFIGYSKKLILEHRKLNNMLEYYDKTLALMKRTHHYFPAAMQGMFLFILDGIEKKKEFDELTIEEELSAPLQNFMDSFLEISLLFRTTYGKTNRNKISELTKVKDALKVKGNYGKDVAIIDGSLKKEKPFSFKSQESPEESILVSRFRKRLEHYIDKGYFKEENFLEEMHKILSTSNSATAVDLGNAMLASNLLEPMEKDIHWKELNFKEQVELIQNSSIVDHIRQIFSQFEYFDLHFNIIKNIDCLTLLQYLASIRNKVFVHKNATEDRKVDLEYLYESFIYSYEGMLIQYQYVLSQIDNNSELVSDFISIDTNYIQLNKEGQVSQRKFKVFINNISGELTLDETFAAEIKKLYPLATILTKAGLELNGISLKELEELKKNFKISDKDIAHIDFLNLNHYAEIDLKNTHIELKLNTAWLK